MNVPRFLVFAVMMIVFAIIFWLLTSGMGLMGQIIVGVLVIGATIYGLRVFGAKQAEKNKVNGEQE